MSALGLKTANLGIKHVERNSKGHDVIMLRSSLATYRKVLLKLTDFL
jgi:hypothetical protein